MEIDRGKKTISQNCQQTEKLIGDQKYHSCL